MTPQDKDTAELIQWINMSEDDRRTSTSRPVAFVNFQNHVVITTEHMLVFEPEGIAMDDASVTWVALDTDLEFDAQGVLNLTEIMVSAIPLDFNHTDLVVAWDHEFNPHCILLSREDYIYFYTIDPEFPATATLLRKCTSVETQLPVVVRGANGFAIEVSPTANFFDLSSQIKNSLPDFLDQELSLDQMKKISNLVEEFDLILSKETL
jgi:hypothetical protein